MSNPEDRRDGGTGESPDSDMRDGSGEPIGSVGDEAAKLFGAFSDWAQEHGAGVGQGLGGFAGHAAAAARDVDQHLATDGAECTVCPICRTMRAVRQTTPEVRAHLATAASSLMQAAAGMLATQVPGDEQRSTHVERIDLDDDLGPDGES